MKYQTANSIRRLIDALIIENGEDSLQCACVDTHDEDLEWKVCIFSRNNMQLDLMHAYAFAFSLKAISPTLTCHLGSYDRSVYGTDIQDAIIIV